MVRHLCESFSCVAVVIDLHLFNSQEPVRRRRGVLVGASLAGAGRAGVQVAVVGAKAMVESQEVALIWELQVVWG